MTGLHSNVNTEIPIPSTHERHCFVVMPFGRDHEEQKHFCGWYEVVIKPAIIEAGYDPILAANEEQPGAINDEIRTHLALDPMVVVDLGGVEPEDEPNPNVMYELGIRHALGLSLVIMAWKGQKLPFDINNQRAIMEDRGMIDIERNKKRLVAFIAAAQQGKFYRPMEAVGRMATIQAASENLGEDSLLRALAQEVRELRTTVSHVGMSKGKSQYKAPLRIKTLLKTRDSRKDLYKFFIDIGGSEGHWARVLRTALSQEGYDKMKTWEDSEWKNYIETRWKELQLELAENEEKNTIVNLDPTMLEQVKDLLPPQPWPKGTRKMVADKLGLTDKQSSKYVNELIRRGDFLEQVDGQLIPRDITLKDVALHLVES
jgi:hypothetical protein